MDEINEDRRRGFNVEVIHESENHGKIHFSTHICASNFYEAVNQLEAALLAGGFNQAMVDDSLYTVTETFYPEVTFPPRGGIIKTERT